MTTLLTERAAPAPRRDPAVWLGLALALLAGLPVLVASLPQMGDFSAHLARYHVMLEGDSNPVLAGYYAFDWRWTGNVGVDLLIRPLAGVLGLEAAGRVICFAIPVLTGLGILSVEWALRRRVGVGALLAMAFIWSPALVMGFVNFGLSLALALFAFALWVRLEGREWRWALFLPIGLAVWLCHVSGWGILGVMVGAYELNRTRSWRALLAPLPLALPAIPLLLGGGSDLLSYGPYPWIYKKAIWTRAMRDQIYWLDIATPILVGLAFAAALVTRRIDPRLGWAALLLAAATFAVPRRISGGDYADYRLVGACLLVACLAIDWRPARRTVLCAAAALFLVRLTATTAGWHDSSNRMEKLLTALDHVPEGARVASAVAIERGQWPNNPFDHLAGYAVVRRDALTNANFAVPTIHMLKLRRPVPDFADPTQRLNHLPGQPIDLSRFKPARQADYLWYIGGTEPAALPQGATVVYRTEGSLLARMPVTAPRVAPLPEPGPLQANGGAPLANGSRRG
jgi:hypothetical protein